MSPLVALSASLCCHRHVCPRYLILRVPLISIGQAPSRALLRRPSSPRLSSMRLSSPLSSSSSLSCALTSRRFTSHLPIPHHHRAFCVPPLLSLSNFSTSKRAQPLSKSIFLWPVAVFKADYRGIIRSNGLDAYFFVRFLRMMVKVFLPIWIISWAVLFPITAVNTTVEGKDGLDKFSFGNVASDKQIRYVAQLILVYFFTCKSPLHEYLVSIHSNSHASQFGFFIISSMR